MRAEERTPPSLALAIVCAATTVVGQTPFHDRGPGELLLPQLRQGPPVLQLDADLTFPAFLWAFQRDWMLPEVPRTALPPAQIDRIAGALLAACRGGDEELRWQSLWALARIGRTDTGVAGRVRSLLLDKLFAGDGALAEVACVAAGLVAHDDQALLDALGKVANDAKAPPRKRAFAFYGLGLAASETKSALVQFLVLTAVQRVLSTEVDPPVEVRVAALHALALTRIDVAPKLAAPALALLEGAWNDTSPPGLIDFVAHVPIAVAAMVARDDPAAEPWRERFAAVAEKQAPGRIALQRSCVLALGPLCRPWDADASPDAARCELLCRLAKDARDNQVANYAWFALGLAGGKEARARLLEGLQGQILQRPWPALGLAAMAGSTAASTTATDTEVVHALLAAQGKVRHPTIRGAFDNALKVVRRERPDVASSFRDRYHVLLPGSGDLDADVAQCIAKVADDAAPIEQRRLAALTLGHLADASPRHWSARLARAVDYRAGTAVLLGLPNGVLRLP
jgi:hypothetical protein